MPGEEAGLRPPNSTPAVTVNVVMAYMVTTAATAHRFATVTSSSGRVTHDHVIATAPATNSRLETSVDTAAAAVISVADQRPRRRVAQVEAAADDGEANAAHLAMSSRRPATATTTAIASRTGPATWPSKATVTAISAETADNTDQIRRARAGDPGQPVAEQHDRQQGGGQGRGHDRGDQPVDGQRPRTAPATHPPR